MVNVIIHRVAFSHFFRIDVCPFFIFFSCCRAARRLSSQRTNRIEVRFRTLAENGVLVVQSGKDDYLVMAVVDGNVQATYRLGGGTLLPHDSDSPFILRSSTPVSDGRWHVALLDRLVFIHLSIYLSIFICTTQYTIYISNR